MAIGYIGLGLMGSGMAARILSAGHELHVYDRDTSRMENLVRKGAVAAPSIEALAGACNLVFTSLPRPEDVEAVAYAAGGLASALRPGSIWADVSTNSLDVVRKLYDSLAKQGISFLDAPVSGGPDGAASGRLAILAGGDLAAYETALPVLQAMGDQIRYVGGCGAGTVTKLVHNLASLTMVGVAAEAMTLGTRAGVDPLVLWSAIRSGVAGRLRSFDNIGKRYLPGRLDPPSFELRLALKDMTLALDMARHVGVPARLSALAQSDMLEALNRGWGQRDAHAFLQLQNERAGVENFQLDPAEIEKILGS